MEGQRTRHTRSGAAAALVAAVLGACSAGSAGDRAADRAADRPSATTAALAVLGPDLDADLARFAQQTLAARRFHLDGVDDLGFELTGAPAVVETTGSVDLGRRVADVVVTDGTRTGPPSATLRARADGRHVWVSSTAPTVRPLLEGKRWAQGDASRLASVGLDAPSLLGVVTVLRAAHGARSLGTAPLDGVRTRHLQTRVTPDAPTARIVGTDDRGLIAGLVASGFDEAVTVDAWVGPDGIIRRLVVTVPRGVGHRTAGAYRLVLTRVGRPVTVPTAPDPATVLRGTAADALFEPH